MVKRMIEVDDVLQEKVKSAIEDVEEWYREWLADADNADVEVDESTLTDKLDYSGRVHEIVDGSVPIYTYQIKTAWFLYGNELEQAFDDAGMDGSPHDNDGMAAIYFYIQEKVYAWWSDNWQRILGEVRN